MSLLDSVQSRLLTLALPTLMPKAVTYAERQARHVAAHGVPLDAKGLRMAERLGIEDPQRVRRLVVDSMPVPKDMALRVVARLFGVLGPETAGLTLGYNLLTHRSVESDDSEQAHELAHVRQFEEFVAEGGKAGAGHAYAPGEAPALHAFVSVYLEQLVRYGHENAPLEINARYRAPHALQEG